MMRSFISRLLLRKDTYLNWFHAFGLAYATSQTKPEELNCLARSATGRGDALEIGTRQGVSAVRIAQVLRPHARLYCVDPWAPRKGRPNSSYDICMRHFRRSGVLERITVLRGMSAEVEAQMPDSFDFVFVDGDHSYRGIEIDWAIVSRRLRVGGIICLHDTTPPLHAPERAPESPIDTPSLISEHAVWSFCTT